MKFNDLLPALEPIISVFEKLGAGYYIGGSVASSSFGIPRTTLDIDIIADLKQEHVEPLFKSLYDDYYIDKDMINEALERKSSFNVIHFATMMKVDIFILKKRAFDREAFRRKKLDTLEISENSISYYFSSPEDIILSKLEWYQMGGQVSERQWNDIIGVLKVQGKTIDIDYLRKWATEIKVLDIFEKALKEVEEEKS
jgi:hypothetical protein